MASKLYTIGYAGFPDVSDFIRTLHAFQIQILIDVRSQPYSAYYEAYNKEALSRQLKSNGIFYSNFAHQFGARQEDLAFYKNGRLDFELFSKSEAFLTGIHQVEKSSASICFMCAEKDPGMCHRTILVARAFSERGYEVIHIKPDGETLTQRDVESQLVNTYFPNRAQESLFEEDNLSEEACIAAAYALRNDEIGFKLEDLSA